MPCKSKRLALTLSCRKGLPTCASYSIVREFRITRKWKTAVLHLQICTLKSRHLDSKKPRQNRGFCGTYLYVAEKEGFEPSNRFWRLHDFQSCALDQLGDFSKTMYSLARLGYYSISRGICQYKFIAFYPIL